MTAISATVPARRVSPLGGMRNTFTLTWRSVLKIRTNMEDVIGLSLQPGQSSPAREPAGTTRPAFSASKVSRTRNWRPPTWTGRPVSSRT